MTPLDWSLRLFDFRHKEPVYSVAFSPDGKFLASGKLQRLKSDTEKPYICAIDLTPPT